MRKHIGTIVLYIASDLFDGKFSDKDNDGGQAHKL